MRRGEWWIVVVVGALLALGGCGDDDAGQQAPPGATAAPSAADASPAPGTSALAEASTGSPTHAVLRVASGFSSVRIDAGELDGDLLHASGGPGSTIAPVLASQGSTVSVSQPQGAGAEQGLVVTLDQGVAWRLELDGGASSVRIDLHDAAVDGVHVTQGVSSLAIALPAPSGTLPVRLDAGASSVRLRVDGGAPVRATMAGGAGSVTLYGQVHQGISGGTRLTSPGWATAADRVDVVCAAGVSKLSVARS